MPARLSPTAAGPPLRREALLELSGSRQDPVRRLLGGLSAEFQNGEGGGGRDRKMFTYTKWTTAQRPLSSPLPPLGAPTRSIFGGAELGLLHPEHSGPAACPVSDTSFKGMLQPLKLFYNSVCIRFTFFLHV